MQAVADLLQGEVRLLGQEFPEFVVALGGDRGGTPAGVGAGLQGAGFLAELEIAGDTVDGDVEQGRDDGQGADAAVHGVDDPLAQFEGVSLHGRLHGSRQGQGQQLY